MNRFDGFSRSPARFPVLLLTVLVAACGQIGGDLSARQTTALSSAPPRGTEQSFAVLGGSTVTNTGSSVITGNLGVNPGTAVTGFPPGIVTGVTHAADAASLQAQADTTTMYDNVAAQPCTSDLTGQDLGGKSLVPGLYCFSSSAGLTGQLTLDAGGVANAVWEFQMGSTLTTGGNSAVLLLNGANPCNVFWKVGSSATLGTNSAFVGTLLALTSVTLTTGANVSGRALARNGAVTLDSNTITVPVCDVPVTSMPPTLGKSFSPGTINAGGVSTLTITLNNANDTPANLAGPLIDTLPAGLVVVAGSVRTTCVETPRPLSGWFIVDTAIVGLTAEGLIPANSFCTVTADVTAPLAGNYVNTLPAGALQTDQGNNAEPALATLTVLEP